MEIPVLIVNVSLLLDSFFSYFPIVDMTDNEKLIN